MKRVLVFGVTENPGGVESVIMNYYRNIDRNKIQFDFLCNTKEVAYEDEIIKMGGKIYKITGRSVNRRQYMNDMEKFFSENAKKYGIKYRIIHSHNSENMDSKLRGLLHKFNKKIIIKYATDFWACQ